MKTIFSNCFKFQHRDSQKPRRIKYNEGKTRKYNWRLGQSVNPRSLFEVINLLMAQKFSKILRWNYHCCSLFQRHDTHSPCRAIIFVFGSLPYTISFPYRTFANFDSRVTEKSYTQNGIRGKKKEEVCKRSPVYCDMSAPTELKT